MKDTHYRNPYTIVPIQTFGNNIIPFRSSAFFKSSPSLSKLQSCCVKTSSRHGFRKGETGGMSLWILKFDIFLLTT